MLELLFCLTLAVVLVLILFNTTAGLRQSFARLQELQQLQEAQHYIASQLERSLAYDALQINLRADGKVIYRGVQGNKQYTLYADKQGIYLQTRTGTGTGVNPVSLEGIAVSGWQVRHPAPNQLRISYCLSKNKAKKEVVNYINCYNARISDDD